MKNSIKIQVRYLAVICLVAMSLTSCLENRESKDVATTSNKSITKPNIDIHSAVVSGNLEAVKQHIESGTDINQKETMSASTPLMSAITFDKPKIVKVLINSNADLSVTNNDGSTALHTAAFFGRIEMVKMLLDAGADTTIKNNFGATPRETVLAEFKEMKPMYEMLTLQLEPMGFKLDLNKLEKARPIVAMMLQ